MRLCNVGVVSDQQEFDLIPWSIQVLVYIQVNFFYFHVKTEALIIGVKSCSDDEKSRKDRNMD